MHTVNLMTPKNLAVVFGPTILRPREETIATAANSEATNFVCETLIINYKSMFEVLSVIKSTSNFFRIL